MPCGSKLGLKKCITDQMLKQILFASSRLMTHKSDLFSNHEPKMDTVPALDYFVLHPNGWRLTSSKWQLVTPYLGRDGGDGEGTLSDFAERLKREKQTFQDLDLALRPKLHGLLRSLAHMHYIGFVGS